MFYYFGFGSNMSLASLRAKGVVPLRSQSAVLNGWRLRFNVQHFFRNEGGVGNIERTDNPNDQVFGVLHEFEDDALTKLDVAEAYGYGYDRITIQVEVSGGTSITHPISALTYMGMPEFIDNSCLPSRRYLNIILEGAVQAGLDPMYIDRLKRQQVHSPKDYPVFTPPQGDYPSFDVDSLKKFPLYTALHGSVFDMSDARPLHEFLKKFFGGRDMTLFHLKRLDGDDNQVTVDDIIQKRLNSSQRKYLNSFLCEYAIEYQYVGHFSYRHE